MTSSSYNTSYVNSEKRDIFLNSPRVTSSSYNTSYANSEKRDIFLNSPRVSSSSYNRSSFRDWEKREAEVNNCSPGFQRVASPRDSGQDELEDLLLSALCLAGKTFLLAIADESLEGDLCYRIQGEELAGAYGSMS